MRIKLVCPKAKIIMPRGRKKKNNFKPSPFLISFLLVIFLLIKIGSVPLLALRFPLFAVRIICTTVVGNLLRFKLPKLKFPSFSFPHLKPITYNLQPKRGRPPKYRIPKKYKILVFGILALILLFTYTLFTIQATRSLPSPQKLISSEPLTTEFFDRNGVLLYRLYEGRNRTLVELKKLPPHLIQATLSIEDKNFYSHPGFDLQAILRATINNFQHRKQQGASTITQQLIKNTLLTPEKSFSRKFKEIFLAFWAERIYSKQEILQMYFNEAPYGGPAWGIEAAAETYFGKQAQDLNLAESSYLAGLPASPTEFSPYGTKPGLAKTRQQQVLERMVEDKYITKKEADEAFAEKLSLLPRSNNIKAPHFVMFVKDLLAQKYGPRVVSQGGLKIYTTLDLEIQEKAEEIVKREVGSLSYLSVQNGAAMIVNAKTGEILAMVGSKDYHEPGFGNFNVTTALRQPGSSIKPITYATSFKKGYSPGNTILDIPVSFKDGPRNYIPVNYDGKFHGPVSIRQALGSSYNIPAVKMLSTVGIEDMINTAKDLGITTFNDISRFGLSLTLGGGEVRMIDMMSAYNTLSQNGYKKYPTPILKVTDSSGNLLEEFEDTSQQVIQPEIAYLITDILKDNRARTPAFGSFSLLNIPGFEVAVKTGTSDNKRDNWTFGYTPKYVVGVWVGNNDNTPMNQALASGVTGAAPIWNKIMHTLLDGTEPLAFTKPQGVTEVMVDGRRDLATANILPKSLVRVIKKEDKFTFQDAFTVFATSSANLGN